VGWRSAALALAATVACTPLRESTSGQALGPCVTLVLYTMPFTMWRRHTSRFLLIWLTIMPFTLWAAYGWTSILMSGIFAFLMLGIDEIGVQIEEPFGCVAPPARPDGRLPADACSALAGQRTSEARVRSCACRASPPGSNPPSPNGP
jgi:hypothetical protein